MTGQQVREACALLHWNRFDLQRWTALPLVVVDRALNSAGCLEGTMADEIILKNAFHRAGIDFTPDKKASLREGRR